MYKTYTYRVYPNSGGRWNSAPWHSASYDQVGFNESEILSNCSNMRGYSKVRFLAPGTYLG